MADFFEFQQIPGGGIRPKPVPASDIYGSPKFDLPGMFARLFGGTDEQQAATSEGALPSNNQPAVAQGGSPGNQPAAAPALAGAQQPPASPSLMPTQGGEKPFWMDGTDVAGPYSGLAPAGTPPQQADNQPSPKPQAGPEMVKQEVERAKQGAKAAPEKAKQMADALEGTGVDLVEAYNELFDQLGGVEKPETELTKEEKGLFIMSFGLRMMAASETMSAGGAFGAAGVPTVQEMRGLKESRKATAQEQTEQRRQRALELLSERVRQREGALDRAAKPPATYDSASGLRTWNPQTREWEQSLDPNTGNPIQAGPNSSNRPFAFERKYQLLRQAGYSEDESAAIAYAGAEDASSLAVHFSDELRNLPRGSKIRLPDGRRVSVDRITNEERNAWIQQEIANVRRMMTKAEEEERGGGGLQNAPGPGVPPGAGGAAPPQGQQQAPFQGQQLGAAPPVGTVDDGFVFKGGDPSDPRNWQRQ